MNCSKFHEIKKCRVCGNEHFDVVLDLGDQYLSGIFPKEIDKDMYKGPLTLVKCNEKKVDVVMFNYNIPLISLPCMEMSTDTVLD